MDNLTKLRYWTFKILPLVYDDSLSYYEVLTKVTAKVNELVDSNNAMPQAITNEITKQLDESYATDINNKINSAVNTVTENANNQINKLANEVYAKLITAIATDEGNSTFTTNAKSGGELIFLNGTLYKVTAVMPAGTNYIIGTNIIPIDISKELKDIKETYLSSNNEHWNDRSTNNYDTGTYLFWKDVMYVSTKNIKVNDILYNEGDNQNLKQITLASEITNLQKQIDDNDDNIKTLQTEQVRQNTRINNIVAQSGNDNTEIVDARQEASALGERTFSNLHEALNTQFNLIANSAIRQKATVFNNQALNDLNTAEWNKVYIIFNTGTENAPANLPIPWKAGAGGVLLTIDSEKINCKTQVFISYDSETYTRYTGSVGQWREWKKSNTEIVDARQEASALGERTFSNLHEALNTQFNLIANSAIRQKATVFNNQALNDLNTAEWNKVYIIFNNATGNAPANMPIPWELGTGGVLLTIDSGTDAVKTQVFISYDSNIYLRRTTKSGGWSNWSIFGSKAICQKDAVFNNKKLNDLNTAEWNKVYIIFNDATGNAPANMPIPWELGTGGVLLTIDSGTVAVKTQVFISYDSNIYLRRTTKSGWSNWKKYTPPIPKTIIVGPNENITKINDAITLANDGDTILVKAGIYNPYTEGLTDNGYEINKSIKLLGEKGAIINCNLSKANNNYSPLNIFANGKNITIDGFTINATNCRYCIHDEQGGGSNNGGWHIYKNLILNNKSLKNDILKKPRCLGSGMTGNERIEIYNCTCSNAQENLSAMDFHTDWIGTTTNTGMTEESEVIVEGCVCKDNVIATITESSQNNTKGITMNAYNNLTKGKPFADGNKVNVLNEWNNTIVE